MPTGSTNNVSGMGVFPIDCTISGPSPYSVLFVAQNPASPTPLPAPSIVTLATQTVQTPLGNSITLPSQTSMSMFMNAALQTEIVNAASIANVAPVLAQFLGWVAYLDYLRNGGS